MPYYICLISKFPYVDEKDVCTVHIMVELTFLKITGHNQILTYWIFFCKWWWNANNRIGYNIFVKSDFGSKEIHLLV